MSDVAPWPTTPGGDRWAVVTGASSGIGAALAVALAKRGLSLALVARNGARLQHLARELEGTFGVATRVHVHDLEIPAEAATLAHALCDLQVDVLVNNAGFGVHGPFTATPLERETALLDLQIKTALILTKSFLPSMVARGHGRILNVASVYSFASVPRQAVYAACKSFLLSWSAALDAELCGTGVSVTLLCPGVTATEFRTRSGRAERPSRLSMSAAAVAEAGCRALFQGRLLSIPGWWNRAYVWASRFLPRRFLAKMTRRLNVRRGLEGAP